MSKEFLNAALSYYGLADTQHQKAEVYTNDRGQILLAVDLALTGEDMVAIVNRMQAMQQEPPAQAPGALMPSHETMRATYDSMTPAERAPFGSFAKYRAWVAEQLAEPAPAPVSDEGVGGRKVVHVDAEPEPAPELPAAVWVPSDQVTDLQVAMASDMDAQTGACLLQVDMLTAEQRAKYVPQVQP